jgi:hypothetical protein
MYVSATADPGRSLVSLSLANANVEVLTLVIDDLKGFHIDSVQFAVTGKIRGVDEPVVGGQMERIPGTKT